MMDLAPATDCTPTKVTPFERRVAIRADTLDDIVPVVNPVRAMDLKQILLMVPEQRRIAVAMAFVGITTMVDLLNRTGMLYDEDHPERDPKATSAYATCTRWFARENKMPLGAGMRIAKVFGVPAEILLAWWA